MSQVTVELRGLEIRGYHGATEDERRDGQPFLFDVELVLDTPATTTDALADTVDYREVAETVREISDGRRFTLLEALASACAEELLARFAPLAATVRVRKPEVRLDDPVEFSAVTATAARES
jgi:dihydroneopterin aldolase